MKLQNLSDYMNNIRKKIQLNEDQVVMLTNVFQPIPVRTEIPRNNLDNSCIEIKNINGTTYIFINFVSNKKIICTTFINGVPLSIVSIENALYSTKEMQEKYPTYKQIGDGDNEKFFPISIEWFNENFKNLNKANHAVFQLGIIVDLNNFLTFAKNSVTLDNQYSRISVTNNSPLIGNRQTRRKNKNDMKNGNKTSYITKNTLVISLPEAQTIEKLVMENYNMTKRTVKAHSRKLRNGITKQFHEKVYYKFIS